MHCTLNHVMFHSIERVFQGFLIKISPIPYFNITMLFPVFAAHLAASALAEVLMGRHGERVKAK